MKRKNTVSKCWAVVDQKYGIVALYWSKKEADEACELGEVLISGYAGSVEEVEINGYAEWQDYMGGDDWDHGQYDE